MSPEDAVQHGNRWTWNLSRCQTVYHNSIQIFFCGYVSEINTIKYQNSWGKKLETCLISMPKARVCGAIGLGSAETMAFEYLQRGKLHGQPLPVFYHPPSHESEVFFKCLNRVSGIPVSAHCLSSRVLESVGRIIPFLLYHSSADIYWLPALLVCFFFLFALGSPELDIKWLMHLLGLSSGEGPPLSIPGALPVAALWVVLSMSLNMLSCSSMSLIHPWDLWPCNTRL